MTAFLASLFLAGKPVGNTVLYTGFRHRKEDYLYDDELEKYKKDGVLTKLYVAFSRDQAKKVYVQQLLAKNSSETWKILQSAGHVYICGLVFSQKLDSNECSIYALLMPCSTVT